MDEIFRKTTSVSSVVKIAHDTPRRYGKDGELLVDYIDPEKSAGMEERGRSSIARGGAATDAATEKRGDVDRVEKQGNAHLENGDRG